MNYLRISSIALLFLVMLALRTQPTHADDQPDFRLKALSQVLEAATEYGQLRR